MDGLERPALILSAALVLLAGCAAPKPPAALPEDGCASGACRVWK